MINRAIIYRPLINEKSMALVKLGFYTFEVDKKATKSQIAKSVVESFKVDIVSIKTVNISGKVKIQKSKKGRYTLPGIRKAIVKIKKGQKIALFEAPKSSDEVKVTTAESETAQIKEKKSILKGTKIKIEKAEVVAKESKQKTQPRKGSKTAGKGEG